jgi:hypothetical protein
MPYYKFAPNEVLYNRLKTFPRSEFYIYGGRVYYNNKSGSVGKFSASAEHIPNGYENLYEMNVDMPERSDRRSLIYPFIVKGGSLTSFRTVGTSEFNQDFNYGDELTGSYPMSASIVREHFAANHESTNIITSDDTAQYDRISALKNTFDFYIPLSDQYAYSSSLDDSRGGWNKGSQAAGLISIPSIFYGSSIKKGSVELNFYVTGTLIGQLKDENRNGELVQTLPVGHANSGSKAGVVLYNEGFLLLTGSWDLSNGTHTEAYLPDDTTAPTWIHFGAGANDGYMISESTASSFEISFHGINYIPYITMFPRAPKGRINHSNNPTYLASGTISQATTGSRGYVESTKNTIKNIVSGAYSDVTASFKKQTFISKIGIYDEDKNLIAIAKMATPVKKTEDRDLTFKLKLDI